MNARTTLVDGRVVVDIDLADLIGSVPADGHDELMQKIACEDSVIRHVMDQVLTGLTENGSCGRSRTEWQPADGYPTALEMAREGMLRFAEPATQAYLERLRALFRHQRASESRRLAESRQRERRMMEEACDLRAQLRAALDSASRWEAFANRTATEGASA